LSTMAVTPVKKLMLANFRAFSEEVSVPLSKITLLYGQNSAGKSSILKALLLLQQSLRGGEDRRRRTFVFSGDSVDLGSFTTTVFSHDPTLTITLGTEFDFSWPAVRETRSRTETLKGGVRWTIDRDMQPLEVHVRLGEYVLRFDRLTRSNGNLFVLKPDDVDDWCRLVSDDVGLFASTDQVIVDLQNKAGFLPIFRGGLIPTLFAGCIMRSATGGVESGRGSPIKDYGRRVLEEFDDTMPLAAGRTVADTWTEIVRPMERHLRSAVRNLSHLGPLRQEPQRLERYTPTSERHVGSTGQYMLSLMNDNKSLVGEMNNCLSLMDLPYKLRVRRLGEQNVVGSYIYLSLENKATGLELSPSDVGVGYSQVLPLIAQSVLSRNSLICIEQPELHLHPAMQARLADVFIQQAQSGNDAQFLIETHSESLMLRILRRVREGTFAPEDVQVLYIDQSPGGESRVIELPIHPSGDFAKPWPHGFFDERLEEFGL